ncbi:hypothetical protein ACEWY4_021877 [Coilia grayii]|uniref:Uncharacterized protein n=1 Tax=Coilia grayii TaxID=363190 RepID=A0ABD1J5F3_9TELE
MDYGGKELKNNNKHQIRTESRCSTTLTEELRGPNSDHTRRCQLIVRQQVQTSATYTIRVTESSTPKADPGPPGVKPTSSSSSSSSSSSKSYSTKSTATTASTNSGQIAPAGVVMAGVGVCVCLLAATLIAVVVIRKRRANAGGEQKHKSGEQEAELHYAAFQHLNPTQAGPAAKQSNDTVTYSSVMQLSGGEDQSNSRPVDPTAVYATVQKNNNAHN